MNNVDEKLKDFVRASGEAWLLKIVRDEQQSWKIARQKLDAAYVKYAALFPDRLPGEPNFDDHTVLAEVDANPHKVRALLQSIGASSPDMIAVIWRVVNGDSIKSLDLHYREQTEFVLRVEIESSLSGRTYAIETREIEDATFLRHLGIMRMDEKPLFDGYYALNLAGSAH
jgi:hypothetical protein